MQFSRESQGLYSTSSGMWANYLNMWTVSSCLNQLICAVLRSTQSDSNHSQINSIGLQSSQSYSNRTQVCVQSHAWNSESYSVLAISYSNCIHYTQIVLINVIAYYNLIVDNIFIFRRHFHTIHPRISGSAGLGLNPITPSTCSFVEFPPQGHNFREAMATASAMLVMSSKSTILALITATLVAALPPGSNEVRLWNYLPKIARSDLWNCVICVINARAHNHIIGMGGQ